MESASKKTDIEALADTEALQRPRKSQKGAPKLTDARPVMNEKQDKDAQVQDNCGLASIVFAIEQSRTHYENIKAGIVTCNFSNFILNLSKLGQK